MNKASELSQIYPIHPFPARMTPSLVWDYLPDGKSLRVLDPMAGSGTTLASARAKGHQAIGFDTDPLALLIARAWCSEIDPPKLIRCAKEVLEKAKNISLALPQNEAYPLTCDDETKEFINFWFDEENRLQLAALSRQIMQVRDTNERDLLWNAFSRLIITKKNGASLAMDVSHSRPHKKYQLAPIKPFDKFLQSVNLIIKKAPFYKGNETSKAPMIECGDARELPIADKCVDIIITSPPYLNAIDYLRGHKLSLVWMGYSIKFLRSVRSNNIGSERSIKLDDDKGLITILDCIGQIDKLNKSHRSMVLRYLNDMNSVLSECRRVLKANGQAIIVIGNSSIHGVYISNSDALIALALKNGFVLASQTLRPIPESNRYLPPPNLEKSGLGLKNRMREEVILHFNVV